MAFSTVRRLARALRPRAPCVLPEALARGVTVTGIMLAAATCASLFRPDASRARRNSTCSQAEVPAPVSSSSPNLSVGADRRDETAAPVPSAIVSDAPGSLDAQALSTPCLRLIHHVSLLFVPPDAPVPPAPKLPAISLFSSTNSSFIPPPQAPRLQPIALPSRTPFVNALYDPAILHRPRKTLYRLSTHLFLNEDAGTHVVGAVGLDSAAGALGPLVLKITRKRAAGEASRRAFIAQEAAAFARVRGSACKFVNKAFAVWEDGAAAYFVMERYRCCLAERMYMRPLEPAEVVRLAAQILLAIEELHRLFIVHCDVKPDNVFLDARGHAVLGDYGHAHVELDRDVARFRRGTVPWARGTDGYMAPEVVLGGCGAPGARAIGPKADIFSFGVVVHEMWTSGRNLSNGRERLNLQELVSTMNTARSAMISRDVQHPITADIVENCVRFHPALRWDVLQLKRHAFFGNIDWRDLCR